MVFIIIWSQSYANEIAIMKTFWKILVSFIIYRNKFTRKSKWQKCFTWFIFYLYHKRTHFYVFFLFYFFKFVYTALNYSYNIKNLICITEDSSKDKPGGGERATLDLAFNSLLIYRADIYRSFKCFYGVCMGVLLASTV